MAAPVARKLTLGELREALSIFGRSMRYDPIRIHNRPFTRFQRKDMTMAPNGHIYFQPHAYRSDFSTDKAQMAHLIHELTHVHQYQAGNNPVIGYVFNSKYRYDDVAKIRSYSLLGTEQRASISEDYYRVLHGMKTINGFGSRSAFERLVPFIPQSTRQR